jgi:hypothetical protein
MKGRVETRHLRKLGKFPGEKLNSPDRRWHMIWVEWNKLLDLMHEFWSDPLRVSVSRSPLDEPVTRSCQLREKPVLAQPCKDYFQRGICVPRVDRGV